MHARHELGKRERFHDVVVGARIQPGDPVGDLAAGREDEHGHGVLAAAQSPEQGETVHAGEPDVEHDEVIGVLAQQVEGAFGARRTVDREAARGEPVAQCREEGAVVFDHEQSHRFGGRTSSIAEPDSGRKAGSARLSRAGAFTLSSWKPR